VPSNLLEADTKVMIYSGIARCTHIYFVHSDGKRLAGFCFKWGYFIIMTQNFILGPKTAIFAIVMGKNYTKAIK